MTGKLAAVLTVVVLGFAIKGCASALPAGEAPPVPQPTATRTVYQTRVQTNTIKEKELVVPESCKQLPGAAERLREAYSGVGNTQSAARAVVHDAHKAVASGDVNQMNRFNQRLRDTERDQLPDLIEITRLQTQLENIAASCERELANG